MPQAALSQIDREIEDLRGTASGAVTVGALTYFASRWLFCIALVVAKAHTAFRG
ncbi:MAG: hypothetical protein AB8B82_05850 [Roseovarius sp.]